MRPNKPVKAHVKTTKVITFMVFWVLPNGRGRRGKFRVSPFGASPDAVLHNPLVLFR